MSEPRSDPAPPSRVDPGFSLPRAWRNLSPERRLAVYASLGLFVTLFLPWYQETVIASGTTSLQSASASLTGWGAFSFVEAAVLLVAAGVIGLLFVRASGRAFRVPFGDGGVITAAGFWTCVLIVWRIFDKQGTSSHGTLATTSGIEWGIFVALAVAAFLAYAGARIRATSGSTDLHIAPSDSRRGRSGPRRPRRSADPGERDGGDGGARAEREEIRPRRPHVERIDRDLFEDVDTDWPERPTEPRLTRRRMTDEELRAERLSGGEPPAATDRPTPDAETSDEAGPPSPAQTAPRRNAGAGEPAGSGAGEPAPATDARTRQMTPPSTPAARRARGTDGQLTMPLDRED
jgi:hypothetical protein